MKPTLLAIALVSGLLLPSPAPAQPSDLPAIRAVIEQYFRGHATGDGAEMRKAFLPTAHVEGIRNGQFVSWTAEEYASRFPGRPAPDEASRRRTIDSVDIEGSAAMVRATLVHGATTFTDYFVC